MISVVLFVLTSVDFVGVIDLRNAVLGVPEELIGYVILVGLPAAFLLAIAAAALENELCRLGKFAWGWIIANGVLLLLVELAPVVEEFVWDFAPWLPWAVWFSLTSAFGLITFIAGRR